LKQKVAVQCVPDYICVASKLDVADIAIIKIMEQRIPAREDKQQRKYQLEPCKQKRDFSSLKHYRREYQQTTADCIGKRVPLQGYDYNKSCCRAPVY
jgi:hypothetical protein